MPSLWRMIVAISVCVAAMAPALAAHADDLFAGKTITLVIGYAPGGGYDAYARLAADHLSKFIPGHPTIVPENMEGGGGRRSEVYLGTAAPRDGTVIGILPSTVALESVRKLLPGIDASQFGFIGRMTTDVEVLLTSAAAPTKTFKDALTRETILAAGGSGDPAATVPRVLNALFGARFKVVEGYKGSADMALAMERGEVDGLTFGVQAIEALHPDWLQNSGTSLLLVEAPQRYGKLPNVPALVEFATSEEQRSILAILCGFAPVGRSLATPPGVPAATVAVLRQAFDAMVKDPDFQADAAKRKLTLEPGTGQEVQDAVDAIMATPAGSVARLDEILKGG